MKKINRSIVLGLTILTVGSSIIPVSNVFADVSTQKNKTTFTPTGEEILATDVDPLSIVLVNGVAYDDKGNMIVENYGQSYQRGKFTWAAKRLVATYNSWPKWIKGIIGYGTANTIAKTLERANGKLIDALSFAIEVVGFSPSVARSIASVLVNFIA